MEGSLRLRSVRRSSPRGPAWPSRLPAARSGHGDSPHLHWPCLSQLRPARRHAARLRLRRVLRPARGALRPRGGACGGDPGGPRRPAGGHLAVPRAAPGRRRLRGASPSAGRRWSRPRRLGEALGVDRLLVKDDTRNPTLSFKDRAVAIATARALDLGVDALACASTGNLAGATAAAAAAAGLPAYVFVPADLEPAKIEHALAYGATVVPDRRHLRRRQPPVPRGRGRARLGRGQRQPPPVVRRGQQDPRLRDRRVARVAAAGRRGGARRVGGDAHPDRPRIRGARRAWLGRRRGRPLRGRPGLGLLAGRDMRGPTDASTVAPVRTPDTIVRSLAIGNPADGLYALELARASAGSDRGRRRRDHRRAHPPRRPARGDLHRDRGRRHAGRRGGGPATGRHPPRRRGRGAAHRERPQDAGRRARSACPTKSAPRRQGGPASPRCSPPASARFEAWLSA